MSVEQDVVEQAVVAPVAVQTIEDIELEQAEKDLAEAAKPPAAEPAPEAAAQPAATPAEQEDPDSHVESGKAPIAALKAEREKRQKAEIEAAHLRGQLEATQALLKPAPKPAEPVVDPVEARLAEIEAERIAIAEKFDNGEVSARDWEAQRSKLEREERKLFADRVTEQAKQVQQPQQASIANDAVMENHLMQLEAKYPVLKQLTAADLEPIKALAYRQAEMAGNPIQSGPIGTMRLREQMAMLASKAYGVPPVQQQAQPAAQSQPAALSPAAQAREAKMQMAANMPPDVSAIGAAANTAGMTEAELSQRLSRATEDEQIALLAAHPTLVQKVLQGR